MPYRRPTLLLPILLALALCGCGGSGIYQLSFMKPPAVLVEDVIDPMKNGGMISMPADPVMPYATLRAPAGSDDEDRFYSAERGGALRVGVGRIVLGRSDVTWEEARRISILKNATKDYPIQVDSVEEYGVLGRTRHPLLERETAETGVALADDRFAAEINRRLAATGHKDIFVYVHGYKVNFENPLLVAAELWHFLGYQGVFIPFAWPSHTGRLAYFGDTETARYSSIFFREFLQYLAEETGAERIHILGYSAGTRMVGAALHQMALLNEGMTMAGDSGNYRLGNVMLVGSDIDRDIFATYLVDGLLDTVDHLTLYESPRDKALGIADFVFRNQRIGQVMMGDYTSTVSQFLTENRKLSIVSVERASMFDSGNGHSYFRDSPWVSSDVLATLLYDLGPGERGLEREQGSPVWQFSPGYLERLYAAIFKANPELHDAARAAGMMPPP